jgi:hypothetical protein
VDLFEENLNLQDVLQVLGRAMAPAAWSIPAPHNTDQFVACAVCHASQEPILSLAVRGFTLFFSSSSFFSGEVGNNAALDQGGANRAGNWGRQCQRRV